MSPAAPRLTKLIAILGVLAMAVSLGVAVRHIQPTEASWTDQAHGKSTPISAGQPYARAISSYGTMFPVVSSRTNLGPNEKLAGAAKPGTYYDQTSAGIDFTGVAGFLPLQASNRSCARAGASSSECGAPGPQSSSATSYAVAETSQLKMWAGAAGANRLITIGHTLNLNTARTTAECRPGAEGIPGLNRSATVILGGDFSGNLLNFYEGNGTVIPVPQLNGTSSGVWNDGLYRYEGTLSHTSTKGTNKASSQLRLHVRASLRTWPYSQRWTLDMILAHAECGTALGVPSIPARPALEGPWPTARMMMTQSAPTALRSIVEVAEEQGAGVQGAESPEAIDDAEAIEDIDPEAPALEEETALPSLDEAAADEPRDETAVPGTEPPAPATSSPATSDTAAPDTTNPAPSDPSPVTTTAPTAEETAAPETVPTEDATPETTEQAAVAEGPQQPETVRVGRQFAVVNRNGVELGAAKIEDIMRTPGCGVELTLSISTSAEAGPDRWSSLGPDDFAELRSGGTTRDAGAVSSDCAQSANSTATRLSPDRDYEIVIAFQLDDSAQTAMLRPGGTAGWSFDLPPLTATTSLSPAITSPAPTASAAPLETTSKTPEA